jgi:hypothetical protein
VARASAAPEDAARRVLKRAMVNLLVVDSGTVHGRGQSSRRGLEVTAPATQGDCGERPRERSFLGGGSERAIVTAVAAGRRPEEKGE